MSDQTIQRLQGKLKYLQNAAAAVRDAALREARTLASGEPEAGFVLNRVADRIASAGEYLLAAVVDMESLPASGRERVHDTRGCLLGWVWGTEEDGWNLQERDNSAVYGVAASRRLAIKELLRRGRRESWCHNEHGERSGMIYTDGGCWWYQRVQPSALETFALDGREVGPWSSSADATLALKLADEGSRED